MPLKLICIAVIVPPYKIINYCTGLFPRSDRLYMSNVDFVPRQLTFNWSSVSPECPSNSIHYNILVSNCGSCPTTTNYTTVTCTDVPTDGSVCTFAIQIVICGNITGNMSVPIRVNTHVQYKNLTQNSGMHNSLYITSISSLVTALIISVVVSITVIVMILMRSRAKTKKLKAAFNVQPVN